jgi:hypothetical protein
VSEFDFSLVRLIFVAEERVFTLVLIAPLQVCSKVFYLSNTVLIAPLQSPWSSVTQGPFLGQFLSQGNVGMVKQNESRLEDISNI